MRGWTLLFAAASLALGGAFAGMLLTQRPEAQAREGGNTPARATRIAYVNIVDLMKNYDRLNKHTGTLNERRKVLVEEINDLRNEHARLAKNLATTADEAEKAIAQEKMTAVQRRIEDIDKAAQRELSSLGDKAVLDTYNEVADCIAEIAKERDLDVVEIFPSGKPVTPAVANLVLRPPAGYPIYLRPGMDITDDVAKRLNEKYPAKKK